MLHSEACAQVMRPSWFSMFRNLGIHLSPFGAITFVGAQILRTTTDLMIYCSNFSFGGGAGFADTFRTSILLCGGDHFLNQNQIADIPRNLGEFCCFSVRLSTLKRCPRRGSDCAMIVGHPRGQAIILKPASSCRHHTLRRLLLHLRPLMAGCRLETRPRQFSIR